MFTPLLLLWLALSCAQDPGPDASQSDILEYFPLRTADGVQINLHHLAGGSGPPVLLVHGISSNHHTWRLSNGQGFAEAAAQAGLDPWLLDLRGRGTVRGDPSHAWLEGNSGTLDDYAGLDLPAAIAEIQAQTGADRVGYVGHSMGGMVGAVYLATTPDAPLYAFVALGSPVAFDRLDPLNQAALGLAYYAPVPWVDSSLGAELRAAMGEQPSTPVDAFVDDRLFNDIAPEQRPRVYRELTSPMTRGEMRHLGQIGQIGALSDASGQADYLAPLAQVDIPAQIWAGAADQVAPPWQVQPLAEHLGQGAYVLAGRETGFQSDYGHLDLVLGDNAASEVYPMLTQFLLQAAHAPR